MKHTGILPSIGSDQFLHFGPISAADHLPAGSVEIPDAHLLFSGNFERVGADLILSDQLHRVIVPNYFRDHARPLLVSPEGAQLDPGVIDALTGHTLYAQAGAPATGGKAVGHVVKMTGSASIVRNGVAIVANVGDVVYQSDVVQTGSGSTLGLVLDDGTTFNLSASSRFLLNELTYDAGSTSNSSLMTLVQGAASFVAGQVAKTGDMRVATPTATIGIRGTAVILDVSATDGKVSVSVVDQQDGLVHAVQVFNTAGVLIATVTSNGSTLTLTPTANFDVIAQQSNKTTDQVAQEFSAFQQVLSTYDSGKQLFPNLPQHTENKDQNNNNANPNSTTKFAGSPPLQPPGTEYQPPAGTNTLQTASATTSTVVVTITSFDPGTGLPSTKPVTTDPIIIDPIIIPVKLSSIPFVVTPPSVAAITSGAGDHIGPVMSANGDVVYDPDGAIYFFSRETGTTTTIASPSNGWTYGSPTISSDGRYIVYEGSDGGGSFVFVYGTDPSDPVHYHLQTELAPGSAPAVSGDGSSIVVEQGGNIAIYDLQGSLKAVITPAAAGSSGTLWKPAISADGHIVAFWNSDATISGGAGQLDVLDLSTGAITQIGSTAIGAGTAAPTVSADGHLVAYQSTDGAGHSEIYLYDLNAGSVVFHTSNSSGSSYSPVLSPDGHFIVFTSDAQLTSTDHNSFADIYIVDVTDPAAPVYKLVSDGVNAASSGGAAISAGGQYVAFGNSSNIFFADPTSGLSTIILETAKSPAVLTANGSIAITGDYAGVSIGVTDQFGGATPNFSASFDSAGHINWTFTELKSDFAALSYGQDATQEFIVTLSADNGTLTIPVFVTVHDGVQPVIQTADAAPVAAPVTLAQGQQDVPYTITSAALLKGVADIDGPSLTITSLTLKSGGGSLVQNADLTWTYTPDPGFSGHVVFDYTVSDSIKPAASTASLNIALPLAITSITPDSGVAGDFITNGMALTVSGTNGALSAGEKIQISSDGGITWSDVAQTSESTWSLTDPAVHTSNFSYQARVVDSANNAINSVVQAITIDTAPPVVAITNGSGLTNQASQIITGTVDLADAGTTVIVLDNSHSVAGAIVGADGSWSTVVSLSEGNNRLVAQDTDVAGNVGVSNIVIISLDTTPPSAVATVTALSPDSGISSADFNTNVASQTISGTYTGILGSGEVIEVSADGGVSWVTASASNGTWSASGVTLSPGAGLLSVRTIDLAGNSTPGMGHSYTLDQNAPTAVATVTALGSDTGSSSSDFVTNSSSQTVSGTYTGTVGFGETIQVSADGGVTWVTTNTNNASWSASGVMLSTGTGALSVRTIDLAGNITVGTGHSYTLDQTAPSGGTPDLIAASDSGISSTDNITNVLAPSFTVSLGPSVAVGDTVQLMLNGASFAHPLVHSATLADLAAQSISFTVGSGDIGIDGVKQISALFTDAAGNSSISSALAVTLDTSAPVVAIDNLGGNTNQVAQTISGTVDLVDSGATVNVLDGGMPVATATVQANGSWSASVTLQSGNNNLTAQVTDTAGNQGVSNVVTYTLNTTAPIGGTPDLIAASDSGSSSADNITNVTAPTFSVALGANVVVGDTVELLLGGLSLANPVLHTITSADFAARSVNLTVTAGDLGSDGDKQISARLTDSFGNSSTTAVLIITLDTTAPTAVATVTALSSDTGSSSSDFITNAASQTVSGTYTGALGSGETVQVSADGGTTWVTATVNASTNTWSAAGVTLLATGTTLAVRTIDLAGNFAVGTGHSYTLDTTAPTAIATVTALSSDTGSSNSDFVTNVASQTVNGTYTGTLGPGEAIRISADGGTTWVTATVNASNHTWSASGVTLSPTGTTLSVQTIDTAGNATAGTSHSYTLDTSAPTAVAMVTTLSSDSGSSPSDFITSVASQTVSGTYTGTLGSGEIIQVSADGGSAWVAATANTSNHTWSASGVTLSPSGTALSVQTIDTAGNATAGTSHSYTLDTSAPTAIATVTALSSDSGSSPSDFVTNVASQTVSGTYTGTLGSGETIQVSADGGTTWVTATANASANTWSAAGVTLSATGTTLAVRTIDLAGNFVVGTGHSYTLDTTAPTAIATVTALSSDSGSSPSDFVTNVASQTVSGTYTGTLGPGETIRVSADGGTTWVTATVNASNHTWSASGVTLSPSGTALSVQTIDTAGNATAGTPHSYTLDTAAPTAVATVTALSSDSGSSPSDFITSVASQTVSGTYSGTLGSGETIQVSADGGTTWVTATVNTSNHTWSASGVTLLPSGTALSVQTIDTAGNVTAGTSHSYTLDTSAPTAIATVTALSSDTGSSSSDFVTSVASQTVSGTYTGTLGSGETIQVSADGGSTWVTATANASTNTWSAAGVTLLAAGTTLSVRTIDLAGNVTTGTEHSYTLDTATPPESVAIASVAGTASSSSTSIIVTGTNGALRPGDKVQISTDNVTWTDVAPSGLSRWSFTDNVARSSSFTYFVRVVDSAGNVGATATQPVVVASNGATIPMAAIGGVAEFTGSGGSLQIGAAGISGTINAISIASGSVAIGGSGNVTATTGDAIDLYATGTSAGNPANLTVNPTGQITGAASGISVIQNASGSITVTTSGPVTGQAGRGILAQQSATGTGSILINGSGNVTGTGAAFSGLVAAILNSANNSDITVSQSGSITGGHDGIRAQTNGNGNELITTGVSADITGLTLYGIEAQSKGTGSISIATGSGGVITSDSAGIIAYNEAAAIPQSGGVTTSSISITANGTIKSGFELTGSGGRPAGILATYKDGANTTVNPNVFGNILIDNYATINAAGGDGIRASNDGSGNIVINDHAGAIVANAVFGIDGISFGSGSVSVTTDAGTSIVSGSHGIVAINEATAVAAAAASTVTVTAHGSIAIGVHLPAGGFQSGGISAGYFSTAGAPDTNVNGTVLVDNYANIASRGTFGIITYNVGYGNITVLDRANTSVSGAQSGINASSSVSGTATPSNVTINVETAATIMSGALYGVTGINANNTSGGNISISTAAGDTITSGGTGINAFAGPGSASSASQISITAAGTIRSGYNVFQGGGLSSGISAGYGSSNGQVNVAVQGSVVLNSTATIIAADTGVSLFNSGIGNISATLLAGSSITAALWGVNAFAQGGGNVTVDNRSTINAGAMAINAGNNSSGSGVVSASNSGTVTAPGAPFNPVVYLGNSSSGQAATFANTGTVTSSLFARSTSTFALTINSSNGTVTNNGTITGNISFNGAGSITNAIGGIWNLNGQNSINGTFSNSGAMNLSGFAALSGSNLSLSNAGSINLAANSEAQIFGGLSGNGTVSLGDRSALEVSGTVAATQTINFLGKGLLTLDNPTSFNLGFLGSGNANIGDTIEFGGAIIGSANLSPSMLTVTSGAQIYSYTVTGAGLSSATVDILAADKIIFVPISATIISDNTQDTFGPLSPAFYILASDTITGIGSGFVVATSDASSANTYAVVVNQTSSITVTGVGSAVSVTTAGANATIINAANVSSGGTGINASSGAGLTDIVDYGNVSGGQYAIAATATSGTLNLLVSNWATLSSSTSYGIFGKTTTTGGIRVTTTGGTITSGGAGIVAQEQWAGSTGQGGNVTVFNSDTINSGAGAMNTGGAANGPAAGAAGIRAGILNGTTATPNASISGDVTVEDRANITAQAGSGIYAFNYGSGNASVTLAPGWSITATAAGATPTGQGVTQYGIFAFTYGVGSTLVNAGWGTTITSGGTGINAGNQATAVAQGSGSTVAVYTQDFISSGANSNNSGTAPAAILAGYNPSNAGTFNSNVFGDVIVNVASDGNPNGNPNPTILAAAGEGINAYDYGIGNVTVTVGSGVSIQALTAATSTSGGNAPYGIGVHNRGPGSITVTTLSGSSIHSGSTGINAVNDATSIAAAVGAVVAVTTAGTIHSGTHVNNSGNTPSGISGGFLGGSSSTPNLNVNGAVLVNNAAAVTADAGIGINAYNYGNGNIAVNDAIGGNITAGSHGIDAHAEGAGTGDVAVNIYANTTITAGTVTSTAYGILAFSTDTGSISVVTSAGDLIDSHLASAGINAVSEATSIAATVNSSVVVTNSATIHSGAGLTGFDNQPAGILAGYVGGTTNPSPGNLANYNVNGEVVVNNFGNITADAGDGIRAYNFGVGDVTVNNFAGTISALGGVSPPNGSGIGLLAQNFGPGGVYVTTSASTTISSGGSGIAALNKAISADPANPSVVVPATAEIFVNASGAIHSGTIPTATVANDPPAGILAGYNPNNLNTANDGVLGNVLIYDHATIVAPTGTDGIRAVNYGKGDITLSVESGAEVFAGRYGVAAFGFDGGDVSVTIAGSVVGGTAGLDVTTTGTGAATIDNTGFVDGIVLGYNATFTNEAGADWQFSGAAAFTGTSTLSNAGTIESTGTSSMPGLAAFTNTGTIAVESGNLTIGTAVTGGGAAVIYNSSLAFGAASDANVTFDTGSGTHGILMLDDAAHFTGTVTGFASGDTIDLVGIAPANVSVLASGGLHVDFGAGSFALTGGYDPAGFLIASDGQGGTSISWTHQGPVIDTSKLSVAFSSGSYTVSGLVVTDSDPSVPTSPVVTYTPGPTPPPSAKVPLTISDAAGAAQTVNFIFQNGSGSVVQGTSGDDVIFAASGQDVLTGGGGRDQFVFAAPPALTPVQHTITDFTTGIDKLDVRQFTSVSWASVADSPNDTLVTLDANDSILLRNVVASNLKATDFFLHA